MNIELTIQIEYLYYFASVMIGIAIGFLGKLFIDRLLKKKFKIEIPEPLNKEESENEIPESMNADDDLPHLLKTQEPATVGSESEKDIPFNWEDIVINNDVPFNWEDIVVNNDEPDYDTDLHRNIAEKYSRMMANLENQSVTPPGTGFAKKLPPTKNLRRTRRVRGDIRYTGSVISDNPGEFANQVFPEE